MKNLTREDGHSMEIRERLSRRLPPLPSPSKPHNLTEAKQIFKKNEVFGKDSAFKDWLELCTCTGDAKAAFKYTERDHRRDMAFKRWLELCTCTSDAKAAFKYTGRDHRRDMAFKRWLELCTCTGDAKSAFKYTNNHQREDWARSRIEELS